MLVLALFYKNSNYVGALAGIFVGLTLRLGGGEEVFNLPSFIPYPMELTQRKNTLYLEGTTKPSLYRVFSTFY